MLSCLCSIRLALQQVTAAKLRDAARKRKVDGTKVPPSSVTACLAFLQLELCACDRGRRSHAGLNGAEQLNLKQGQRRRDLSSTQTSRSNRLRQELSGSIPVAGRQRTKCKSLYIEIQGTAPASPPKPSSIRFGAGSLQAFTAAVAASEQCSCIEGKFFLGHIRGCLAFCRFDLSLCPC